MYTHVYDVCVNTAVHMYTHVYTAEMHATAVPIYSHDIINIDIEILLTATYRPRSRLLVTDGPVTKRQMASSSPLEYKWDQGAFTNFKEDIGLRFAADVSRALGSNDSTTSDSARPNCLLHAEWGLGGGSTRGQDTRDYLRGQERHAVHPHDSSRYGCGAYPGAGAVLYWA